VTSGMVTVEYLKANFSNPAKVYVIGTSVLKKTITDAGFVVLEDRNEAADAFVVGIDKTFDYIKMKDACLHVAAGADFLATNDDRAIKTAEGLVPAAGAIVAAIETATERKAKVMGKPHLPMFESAINRLDLEPHQALMVGDQLRTDIDGAQKAGCKTALVLTGVTDRASAQKWSPEIDIIAEDFGMVVETLMNNTVCT